MLGLRAQRRTSSSRSPLGRLSPRATSSSTTPLPLPTRCAQTKVTCLPSSGRTLASTSACHLATLLRQTQTVIARTTIMMLMCQPHHPRPGQWEHLVHPRQSQWEMIVHLRPTRTDHRRRPRVLARRVYHAGHSRLPLHRLLRLRLLQLAHRAVLVFAIPPSGKQISTRTRATSMLASGRRTSGRHLHNSGSSAKRISARASSNSRRTASVESSHPRWQLLLRHPHQLPNQSPHPPRGVGIPPANLTKRASP